MEIGCFRGRKSGILGYRPVRKCSKMGQIQDPGMSRSGVLGHLKVHTWSGYPGEGSRTGSAILGVPGWGSRPLKWVKMGYFEGVRY